LLQALLHDMKAFVNNARLKAGRRCSHLLQERKEEERR
jgi:hypothetical protein